MLYVYHFTYSRKKSHHNISKFISNSVTEYAKVKTNVFCNLILNKNQISLDGNILVQFMTFFLDPLWGWQVTVGVLKIDDTGNFMSNVATHLGSSVYWHTYHLTLYLLICV